MLKNVCRGIVLCAGLPLLYLGVTGHSSLLYLLAWGVLLLGAPLYTLGCGLVLALLANHYGWGDTQSSGSTNSADAFLTYSAFGGYVWVAAKIIFTTARLKLKRNEAEGNQRAQYAREQKRIEAENHERGEIHFEHREILTGISELLLSCSRAANEMIRAEGALRGADEIEDANRLILSDIARILVSFRNIDSSGRAYAERLWLGVGILVPRTPGTYVKSLASVEDGGVKQLGMVIALSKYDSHRGTSLVSKAVSTYRRIILAASNHCESSIAAKVVADAYGQLLNPYLHGGGKNGNAGQSNSSSRGRAPRGTDCEKCADGFRLLNLSYGTSQDEVESQRRSLAQLLHSDRLGAMNEKVRHAGEEQLKSINAACDHIRQCRLSGSH
ncbi:MAG: hypothetical protein V4555_14945 [Acidobacteriota bacterium]